jgi:hypothetical protein
MAAGRAKPQVTGPDEFSAPTGRHDDRWMVTRNLPAIRGPFVALAVLLQMPGTSATSDPGGGGFPLEPPSRDGNPEHGPYDEHCHVLRVEAGARRPREHRSL